MTRFDFDFSRPLSWPLALLGVTPWTAHVDVSDEELTVRFGPWSLTTSLSNVEGATITGPYLPFKVLGPHVSLADAGVTFGTTWRRGVCVRFRRPVAGALPTGLLKHPAATVTVAEPERLVELLERAPAGSPGEGDELHRVLAPVPDLTSHPVPGTDAGTGVGTGAGTDAGSEPATPVAVPPATRSSSFRPTAPRRARTPRGGAARTGTGDGARRATRTPAKKVSAPPPEEHPTPADMPPHTETEKPPGVTPPADQGLPGPDDAGA